MKRTLRIILMLLVFVCLIPAAAYASKGDNGYEGGISSGTAAGKTTLNYQEISFISGEPVVYKGTLVIRKSIKTDTVTSTYTYNLKNTDKTASLLRTLVLKTEIKKSESGQKIEDTSLTKISETVRIGSKTYTLKNYDLSNTSITDVKPSVNYYSGNTIGSKVYQIGSGSTGTSGSGTVTVKTTGNYYGYDQYWSSAEAYELNYTITNEQIVDGIAVRWGGTAKVAISSSESKKIKYVKNEPYQISFSGGYVQTLNSSSILEYSCKLPEFDSEGNATDNILSPEGSLKLETTPVQTRLTVADLLDIKGHWAEKDIELLCSLEIIKGSNFLQPDKRITRAEFVAAVVNAVKEVPIDTAAASRITKTKKTKTVEIKSPFTDVSAKNIYFTQIMSAVNRGIINGKSGTTFSPNAGMTRADAITILMRTLGLENLSSSSQAVTTFADNDSIPEYARSAVYAAEKIGLAEADSKGYFKPGEMLTKAQTAELIYNLIVYMQEGISKDYKEMFVNFQ